MALAVHHHAAAIGKHALDEEILIQEGYFFNHVARVELDGVDYLIFVGVNNDHLVERTGHQLMAVLGVSNCLAVFHWELDVGCLEALGADDEQLQAFFEAHCNIEGERMDIQTSWVVCLVEDELPGKHSLEACRGYVLVLDRFDLSLS